MLARLLLAPLSPDHLPALLRLDAACDDLYLAAGFTRAQVPPRTATDLARLAQTHTVLVVLAAGSPVALLAWREEPPGIIYLAELAVDPTHHRARLGSRLLAFLHERARAAGLPHLALRCYAGATWATAFYAHHGFRPLDCAAPAKILAWREHRLTLRATFLREGEIALWADVAPITPAR